MDGAITSIKQLSMWGWPENQVTTFCQDANISTTGSTSSSEFAVQLVRQQFCQLCTVISFTEETKVLVSVHNFYCVLNKVIA